MPSSARGKEIRTQGVASVTQDMSSARLKILGDLMESRKRAEQHEQEFLRTIHSENAAFSRIVSLFEDSLTEIKQISDQHVSSLEESLEKSKNEMVETRASLEQRLEESLAPIKQVVDKLETSVSSDYPSVMKQVDSLQTKLMAFISSTEFKSKDDASKINELCGSLGLISSEVKGISAELGFLRHELERSNQKVTESLDDQLASLKDDYMEKLSGLRTDFEKRVTDSEVDLRALLDSRLGGLEEILGNRIKEVRDQLSHQAENSTARAFEDCKSQVKAETSSITTVLSDRLRKIESGLQTCVDEQKLKEIIDEKVSSWTEPHEKVVAHEELIRSLEQQLSSMRSEFIDRLSTQAATMNAIAHSGLRYEWKIKSAVARLTSLGILGGSTGKYVSSEVFNLGPYKNLSLRFFPVSTASGELPTVWLIIRPSGPDAIIPIYVDIGVGVSKRGPLKRKQVQELFGHWVWEACFPNDIVAAEVQDDDLSVSVEISMRQWMDLERLPSVQRAPQTSLIEEDAEIPESPSAMSNYTFVPPQTNPFDSGSVTPRRSSWAQFGSPPPDENEPQNTTRLASNPFK